MHEITGPEAFVVFERAGKVVLAFEADIKDVYKRQVPCLLAHATFLCNKIFPAFHKRRAYIFKFGTSILSSDIDIPPICGKI